MAARDDSVGATLRGMFRRDMERNEQLVGFVGSVAAIALGLAIALGPRHPTYKGVQHVPWAQVAQPLLSKGVVVGVTAGFSVALWLASRHGSRVLTAVVSMAGALFALSGIFGFPFIAYAGWLLIRNSRTMREERAARTGSAGGGRASPARATGRDVPARRRVRDAASTAAPASSRPDASKRYTPPRPPGRGGR